MKRPALHPALFVLMGSVLSQLAGVHASPAPADSVLRCLRPDLRPDEPEPLSAAKPIADLHSGEPRTVRMIYFLPNDRPYREDVVDSMKITIRRIQTFFSDQMEVHGYGARTFRIETDGDGVPLVHRLDGRHADSHYLDDTFGTVMREVREVFDLRARQINFLVIDNSTDRLDRRFDGVGESNGPDRGDLLVPAGFRWTTVAHELGHALGLEHDFRDGAYLMSYGESQDRISSCAARFLTVHSYFATDVRTAVSTMTLERLSSPWYPAGATSSSVKLRAIAPEGLHQVTLFARTQEPHPAAGFPEVIACRGFEGSVNGVVEFQYTGIYPSDASTNLSEPSVHPLSVRAVDKAGNTTRIELTLRPDPTDSGGDETILPRTLAKVSGDLQVAESGSQLPDPLVVEVRDQNGNGLAGVTVTFSVRTGSGFLSGRYSAQETRTDASGRAESTLTLGPHPGPVTVEASVTGLDPVSFGAEATGVTVSTALVDHQAEYLPDGAMVRFGKGAIARGDRALAFSPDGNYLAVAGSIGAWLYDLSTLREVALLAGHTRALTSVAFSPDGSTLLTGAEDHAVKLWDLATGINAATFDEHPAPVHSVAFSPDGSVVASGSYVAYNMRGFSLWLWDLATGDSFGLPGHDRDVGSLAFAPDGSTLASAGRHDETIKLWEVETGTSTATIEAHSNINSVAFSPDGQTLAAGLHDGRLRLWDATTGESLANYKHINDWLGWQQAIYSVVFSPDGASVVAYSAHDGWVRLRDWRTGTVIAAQKPGLRGGPASVAISSDGRTIAASGRSQIGLWAPETQSTVTLEGHSGPATSVVFSPDGTTIAVGRTDGTVGWNVATRERVIYKRYDHSVSSLAFSPDGRLLASATWSEIQLLDVETGVGTTLSGATNRIRSLAFSPDGTTLASGDHSGTLILWDMETGQRRATLTSQARYLHTVAFSSDGMTVSAGLPRGEGWALWAVATGSSAGILDEPPDWSSAAPLPAPDSFNPVSAAVRSPDGRTSASWNDGLWAERHPFVVNLWDVAAGKKIAVFQGHADRVRSVAFSPDGSILASVALDGTALLWDLQRVLPHPRLLTRLSGDEQEGLPDAVLAEPLVVVVTDQNGDPFDGAEVTFAVTGGGGTLSVERATTDARGQALTTLTLGLAPGPNTVKVTVGNLEPVIFTALTRSIPTTLNKVGGDAQKGPSGSPLAEPLVVSLHDQAGTPLAGAAVTFVVTAGEGSLSVAKATTDAEGRAATILTLGGAPGATSVEVRVAGLASVTFTALGVVIPQTLAKLSGDEQAAKPGTQLAEPLVVSVGDQHGTAYPGAVVSFSLLGEGGILSALTDTTDAEGRAATTLTLGEEFRTYTVVATVADLEPITFTATAKASPDFDGDGVTDHSDFFLFAEAFAGSDPRFDLDGSGSVDFADFFLFAEHFGQPARAKLVAMAREMIGLPEGPQLRQNAPNPFNSGTMISWFQLKPGLARLEVFALTGQRVAVLHEGLKKAGVHRLRWDGRDDRGHELASGTYVYRLVTAKAVQTRKLTLLR